MWLLCGCYVVRYIIFRWSLVICTGNFILPGLVQKYNIFMCILNCRQLSGSTTVIASPRTIQCREAPPMSPNPIQRSNESQVGKSQAGIALCSWWPPSWSWSLFRRCRRPWETAGSVMALCGSPSILIRLLHLGLFSGWLWSHCSVVQFQSCNICSYDKTDSSYW